MEKDGLTYEERQAMKNGELTPEQYKALRDKKRAAVRKQHEQALISGKLVYKDGDNNITGKR